MNPKSSKDANKFFMSLIVFKLFNDNVINRVSIIFYLVFDIKPIEMTRECGFYQFYLVCQFVFYQ